LLVSYLRPSQIDGAKHALGDPGHAGQTAETGLAEGQNHLPG